MTNTFVIYAETLAVIVVVVICWRLSTLLCRRFYLAIAFNFNIHNSKIVQATIMKYSYKIVLKKKTTKINLQIENVCSFAVCIDLCVKCLGNIERARTHTHTHSYAKNTERETTRKHWLRNAASRATLLYATKNDPFSFKQKEEHKNNNENLTQAIRSQRAVLVN